MDKCSKMFIVGSPRSGTHWVRRIVAEHPNVINNHYESSICKVLVGPFLNSRLFFNRSWRTVIKNYHFSHLNQWIEFDAFSEKIKMIKKANGTNLEKSIQLVEIVLDEYFYKHGGNENKILVEKTPDHIYYADIILDHFDKSHILEVIRDGRDVFKSLKTLRQDKSGWVPKTTSAQIKLWSNAVNRGLQFREELLYDSRWLTVYYEDLVKTPEKIVQSILEFANLNAGKHLISDMLSKPSTKPRGEGTMENSKHALSHYEKQIFKKITGDLLFRLGYESQLNW